MFLLSSSGTVTGSKSKKGPPVIGATVGVIVLLSAIICLLILHKKRKAKEAASRFQFSGKIIPQMDHGMHFEQTLHELCFMQINTSSM